MKKSKVMFVALMAVLCSCGTQELEDMTESYSLQAESPENLMLSFHNEDEFNETVELLSTMTSEKQSEWIQQHNDHFVSLRDVFNQAMEDASMLDETQEMYDNFRSKYQKYLFFAEYKDDCGAYLPVSNRTIACLLNKDGLVKIGGQVRNMKDISSYSQLQRLGVTLYDDELLPYSGTMTRGYQPGDGLGAEYDSGWFSHDGRKIRLKCGRQFMTCPAAVPGNTIIYRLHVEISFRKKTWLGWMNYVSHVKYEGFYQVGGDLPVQVSEDKNADSSHDYYYGPFNTTFMYYPELNGIGVLVPAVHVELDVDFRGISNEVMPDYNFTLPYFKTTQPG